MDALSASIVSAATRASQTNVQQAVAVATLRTALDLQQATATQLIQAVQPTPQASGGGTLGTLVDTYA